MGSDDNSLGQVRDLSILSICLAKLRIFLYKVVVYELWLWRTVTSNRLTMQVLRQTSQCTNKQISIDCPEYAIGLNIGRNFTKKSERKIS